MKRGLAAWASLLVVGVLVTACTPPKDPPPPPPEEPSELQVSTDPTLFPAFSTAVPDYVSRCSASSAVHVVGSAPEGTTVSVDGQAPQSGDFTAEVTRDVGQSFSIVVQPPSQPPTTHSVRCLPADFPSFTAERSGSTESEWYVTAPIFGPLAGYPAIFDNNGVPVWWRLPSDTNTTFFTLLPDDNLAWTGQVDGGARVFELDGTPVHTINTVEALDDSHDLLLLPNGNYVFVGGRFKCCYDLRGWGGPGRATVLDHVVQELTPEGGVVWEWVTSDHIDPEETAVQWRAGVIEAGFPYDVYHWNSVEPTSTGYVLSYRHLNAVYHIDKATGAVDWKIGGSPRDESLTVVGDPVFDDGGSFAGQHDGRVLDDGTLTLFDNGSNTPRSPRAVRYQLDTTTARTATLLQELTDPLVTSAICCGSTRMLPGGNWVTGWGGINPVATEMTADGERVFLLEFEDPDVFTYRTTPVPPGVLSREELRAAMDAQYPLVP